MIPVNAARCGYRHMSAMLTDRARESVADADKVAERLLAHARLCRHIAEQTWSEDAARDLKQMAEDCIRAADQIAPRKPVN